jgi:hypothetical protein
VYAIFFLIEAGMISAYPYQVSYGEGFLLNQAVMLSNGEPIYHNITTYPFIVGNYPPVYLYLCAFGINVFGIVFSIGRIISLVSTVASGIFIFLIIRETCRLRGTWSLQHTLIGSLFIFASPYIADYFPLFRVDALALALSLAGLYIVTRFENTKVLYLSIPFFVGALFTKQSYVAAPIAAILYLLFTTTKKGIGYAGILVIVYGGSFMLINSITRGQFFLHTVTYNANIWSIVRTIKMYVRALQIHAPLFFIAAVYTTYGITKKRVSLIMLYFIIAALGALTVGKIGSNVNYFGEVIAASCILLGMFLNNPECLTVQSKKIITAVLVLQLILFAHLPGVTGFTVTTADFKNAQHVSEIITRTPGPILSEDAGLLVLNKKPVLVQPFIMTQLAEQGLWDQTPVVSDIESQHFSLIILTFDLKCRVDEERLTKEIREAIKTHYTLQKAIGDYYLYQPIQ